MLNAMDWEFLMFVLACAQARRHDWDETNDRDFDEAVETLLAKLTFLLERTSDAILHARIKTVVERLNDA